MLLIVVIPPWDLFFFLIIRSIINYHSASLYFLIATIRDLFLANFLD